MSKIITLHFKKTDWKLKIQIKWMGQLSFRQRTTELETTCIDIENFIKINYAQQNHQKAQYYSQNCSIKFLFKRNDMPVQNIHP